MPRDRRDDSRERHRDGHKERARDAKRSRSPSRSHWDRDRDREEDRSRRPSSSREHGHEHHRREREPKLSSRRSKEDETRDSRRHERSKRDGRDERGGRGHGHRSKREKGTPSDDEDLLDLQVLGVSPITEDDYYVKSAEFKHWLQDARDRDFSDMSSDQTRRYFRKFVRRWNDGALRERYYRAPPRSPTTSTSRWGTSLPPVDRHPTDDEDDRSPTPGPTLESIGPSFPSEPPRSGPDRQLALEVRREQESLLRKTQNAQSRRKALDRAEEIAPKLGGKEGKMAEKRAVNSSNREMRDKEVGGLEVDESTLMGEGTSFQAALKARDAAAARKKDRRDAQMADARSANEDRLAERRQKENDTMQMLHEMARQRFG